MVVGVDARVSYVRYQQAQAAQRSPALGTAVGLREGVLPGDSEEGATGERCVCVELVIIDLTTTTWTAHQYRVITAPDTVCDIWAMDAAGGERAGVG